VGICHGTEIMWECLKLLWLLRSFCSLPIGELHCFTGDVEDQRMYCRRERIHLEQYLKPWTFASLRKTEIKKKKKDSNYIKMLY